MGTPVFTDAQDIADLKTAIGLLEAPAIKHRLAQVSQQTLAPHPSVDADCTSLYLRNAVQHALSTAITQLLLAPPPTSTLARTFTAISGAVGGSFGFAGSILELPLAIRLLLQSIVQIASHQHFCLSDSATRSACLTIFALNGAPPSDTPLQPSTYYLTRDHLHNLTSTNKSAPLQEPPAVCSALLKYVAQRFSQALNDKITLQSLQPLSRQAEEKINSVFISHYLGMAQGHFIVQRLEKKHGYDRVRKAYLRLQHM